MAIAAPPSTPTFSASFRPTRTYAPPSFTRLFSPPSTTKPLRRLTLSASLNSVSPDNGDLQGELFHGFSPQRRGRGSPVFVTMPIDSVDPLGGQVRRRKTMNQSFKALVAAGVEGVVMEVWWGIVERDQPRVYNWQGYLAIVELAKRCGLKVRAVLAFHQCGSGPPDPNCIPLPLWVLDEIDKDPDLAYCDRFGRRNTEYISIGCDSLPVLRGRSPLQVYADFMRNFRDTFKHFIGVIIIGIQIGMGPAGELRYPSCPTQKLTSAWRTREIGEFQCYDKYMLASLNARAREIGMPEWGNGGPIGASNLMQNPEETKFFRSDGGSWNTSYGTFFLEWYSGMLLLHGERLCREAEAIFWGTKANTSAKVAGLHWHYLTQSHPSELTAGYYNTSTRDGYLPIARMFARYGFSLCCPCFDLQDLNEKQMNPVSSPEGFLRQLLSAARVCDIPVEAEPSASSLDDKSFQQVVKMSKYYSYGLEKPSFSFNFVRMDKNMFELHNWVRFTRFVRQMSDVSIFRAKLDVDSRRFSTSVSDVAKFGMASAYC
ncbi:PREDICTED: beta-amylase 1, chloroplastic-like [Fragaria vesca subsp. vesca]|uniref:beta-amylase 1, chloroplastic-like n=1 Tax=Fragaria vesca subsp. vesca TaxID=101020 RepID=UPI0002C325F0|nr:PREDICTED: beta-amylase 1, chloroplastic-like [Fragaria vesca subsp. vesca]